MADQVLFEGVREVREALDKMSRSIDVATIAALKSTQNLAKRQIKSGMRGKPRWAHRGPIGSGGTVASVNLNRVPDHIPRSGGPGRLSGSLSRAVGGVKRPKKTPEGYSGGVGVGGPESVTNMYRKTVEGAYPYMKPGLAKAQPLMEPVWAKAWDKAIRI